jgi:hypothetical protein
MIAMDEQGTSGQKQQPSKSLDLQKETLQRIPRNPNSPKKRQKNLSIPAAGSHGQRDALSLAHCPWAPR